MIIEVFSIIAIILIGVALYFKLPTTSINIGDITLGNLEHTDSIAYIYYSTSGCSNCTADFTTNIIYSDGESRVVHGVFTTGKAELIFARSDSSKPIKPERFEVEAHLSNPLGKTGRSVKHTYMFN
jgi:hypothetical protein